MKETVVEVTTVNGAIYRYWNISWRVIEGILSIDFPNGKYAVFAAGQWTSAVDVEPK